MENDSLIGRQLANYKVERPLRRGGMAQVYYGIDVKLKRPVAIKVIDARYRDQPDYAKRFVREAQTIAVWRHENIIHIHYADDEDGFYYYVMEYIDGGDLSDLIAQYVDQGKEIPQTEILRMGKAIASALDYAHQRGVIHRDVKPANVMIASDGRVVVTDFGLAMDVDIGSTGEVFGSARYVAPEQARNSSQAVPQSDVYALGIVLYEMLTGTVPFDDPSSAAVALQHLTMPPPPPRTLNPKLNEATETVLLTALNKSPQHRYQTGQSLMEALEAALKHNSTVAAVPSATPPSPEEFAPTVPSKPPAPANTGAVTIPPPPANTGTIPVPPPASTEISPPQLAPTSESAPPIGGINPMLAAGGGAVVAVLLLICTSLMIFYFMGNGSEVETAVETAAVANSTEVTSEKEETASTEVEGTSEEEAASTEVEATSEEVEATPEEAEVTSTEAVTPAEEPTDTPVAEVEELAPTDTPPADTPTPEPATPTPEPKPQVVADSKADFSATLTDWAYFWGPPGSNNWTAMQWYSANHYGKPCWYTNPNHVRTCNNFGNPGNSDDIAWRWRSTVSGTLEIQLQASKASNSGDGVIISVYQGGTDTGPVMQQATQYGLINQTIILDEVSEGEFIFFVMNKNGYETLDDTNFQAKICHYECP
ncbi:protein kinase [Anaerolineales bacterium HSG24]|nr:protein kinase [Anaerolineales bacterium HSG24]